MADVGEKTYVAKEDTAQEILASFDIMALEEDVASLTTSLESILSSVDVGWTSWKFGTASSTITISGTGFAMLYCDQSASNVAAATIYIDGSSMPLVSLSASSYVTYQFPVVFKQSLKIVPNTTIGYSVCFL